MKNNVCFATLKLQLKRVIHGIFFLIILSLNNVNARENLPGTWLKNTGFESDFGDPTAGTFPEWSTSEVCETLVSPGISDTMPQAADIAAAQQILDDKAALIEFYIATNGPNWTNKTNWCSSLPLNTWYGVYTDADGQVININLSANHLTGSIPASIGNLTKLTYLYLGNNQIAGTIPASIGNLTNLTQLSFSDNQLTGNIPAEIGNLTKLQLMFLGGNQLTGSIPSEIGNLTQLVDLFLYYNQLTGSIPSSIGNLNNLQRLFLNSNQLTGSIPASIGSLTNLRQLYLNSNQITGSIPTAIGNLTNLQLLFLATNQLTGSIPASIGNLPNLIQLFLLSNQLTGSIPASIGNLTNLQQLYLNGNQLSGAIPVEIGNLANLTQLGLSSNQLTGDIPSSIGNLSNLQYLYLANTTITGSIPSSIGNLIKLEYLYLHYNQLTGSIPVSFGNLTKLKNLTLEFNQITGSIPSSIGNLIQLTELTLSYNQLTGSIPSSISNLTQLIYLHLDHNQFGKENCPIIHLFTERGGWSSFTHSPQSNGVNFNNCAPIVVTPTSLNFGKVLPGTSSVYKTYTVFATYLIADITVTAPTGYLISTTAGGAYANTLTLTPTAGIVNTTIYVIFSPSAVQAYNGNITHTSTGFTTQFIAVTGFGIGAEESALIDLYNSTNGANWTNNTNWCSDQPLNNWFGVSADAEGHVWQIHLPDNHLVGSIPTSIGNLTNLTQLSFSNNQLTGNIPTSIGNLTQLHRLLLGNNQLTGSIPPELCNLTQLVDLLLYYNQLTGSIPTSIGNLKNLRMLSFQNNQFTGSIPAEIGNLIRLENLSFGFNQLTGSIPTSIGNLTNLKILEFYSNQLTGSIPASIGNLTQLVQLFLLYNQLTGNIPDEIGNLTQLQLLFLNNNQLTGSIPVSIGNLIQLRELLFNNNQLSGSIPISIGNLTQLKILHLDHNQFGLENCPIIHIFTERGGWNSFTHSPQSNGVNFNNCAPIGVTPANLTFGNVLSGTSSAYQTYTVSATDLIANITVTAPTGYLIGTTAGGAYENTLTLTPIAGIVNATIYVIFSPLAVQVYNSKITHASTGFTTQYVTLTGSGITLPVAAGAITGTATVCQGQNFVAYSVAAIGGATNYTWAYSGSGATIDGTTNNITISFDATATSGNLTVQGTNSMGSGIVSPNYAVTVNPLPLASGVISGPALVCHGQNDVSYSVSPIANATTYDWAYSGTGANINGSTNNITISFDANATSGNLSVQGANSCGSGMTSQYYAVYVNPLPVSSGAISGPTSVCQGQNEVIYSVPYIANATGYNWAYSGLGATIYGTTNNITISFDANATSGNLLVLGTNSCGSGIASANYAITVKTLPLVPEKPLGAESVDLLLVSSTEYRITGVPNTDSYIWELSPVSAGDIAGTGTTAKVTWHQNYRGFAGIKVRSVNACGESALSTEKQVFINNTTGVNKPEPPSLVIYPNPNNGSFSINSSATVEKVIIRDAVGRTIDEINYPGYNQRFQYRLTDGVYQILVYIKDAVLVRKIVIAVAR